MQTSPERLHSHSFKGILASESYDMTRTAVESTLMAILGRMAIETKREITWDEMMRSA